MPMLEFGKGSWPTLDEASLDGPFSPSFVDGYQDEQGNRFKRPGQTRLGSASIPTHVQGIFWSSLFQAFFAVGGGRIYRVTSAGAVTEMTGATVPTLRPATFTESYSKVYVAAGGKIVKVDGTNAAYETDPAAPTSVTHVTGLDGHILVNEVSTDRVHWTDAESEEFGAGNFAEANSDLDKIVAIAAGWRELFVMCPRTTEIWYNTGETPGTFQRLEGAFIERGCSAPYSVCKADNTWFWLDHERAVIRLEGRSPKIVSQPVTKQLRDLTSVDDLVVSHFQWEQRRFVLFSSVSQNISWIYDYALDAWYQWGVWNSGTASYDRWPIHSIAYSPQFNQYIMLGDDGLFYSLSADGTDARFYLRSAHQSYGTYDWKFISRMRMRLKRGYTPGVDSPVMMLRWRDQNGTWSNERQIYLGEADYFNNIAQVSRLGKTRTRQFEFVVTDDAPFAMSGVEVDLKASE